MIYGTFEHMTELFENAEGIGQTGEIRGPEDRDGIVVYEALQEHSLVRLKDQMVLDVVNLLLHLKGAVLDLVGEVMYWLLLGGLGGHKEQTFTVGVARDVVGGLDYAVRVCQAVDAVVYARGIGCFVPETQ